MKKYFLYVGLIMISLLGTDLTDFALSIWVLKQPEGTITSYSMIWFFEAAPAVLLAPFIGSFVDRWSKKKIIIYGQVITGIGSIILMSLFYLEHLQPWHIMIVSGIGSIASMFVFSAFYVATTALVPKDKLIKAQGVSTAIYAAISIGVPVASPVLFKMIGMERIFMIDIITFLISILAFLIIRFVVVSKTEEEFNFKNDWKLVKEFLIEKKGLRSLLGFFFITGFLIGLIKVLFTPLILDFSNEYYLGMVLSAVGIGTVIGGVVMSTIKRIESPVKTIFNVNILVGIVLVSLWIDVNLYVLAIGGMLAVLLFTVSDIMNNAFFQAVVPTKMLGRLSGFVGLVIGASEPLSYMLSGIFVDYLNNIVSVIPKEFSNHFPGTTITISIILIFTISGLLLMIVSFFFQRNKKIKNLDALYQKKLKKKPIDTKNTAHANSPIMK